MQGHRSGADDARRYPLRLRGSPVPRLALPPQTPFTQGGVFYESTVPSRRIAMIGR